jgi:hypothetical protein
MSKDEFSKIIKLEGIYFDNLLQHTSETSSLSPTPASQRFFWKKGITLNEIPPPPTRIG